MFRHSARRLLGNCARFLVCLLVIGTPLGRASEAPTERARVSHGLSYQHDEVPDVPWSIHIVKVDRSHSDLELHTIQAKGHAFGLTKLSDQVKLVPAELGRPLAAINGDFYRKETPYEGDPKGLQIMRGELISAPCDWTCFWFLVFTFNGRPANRLRLG